MNVCLLSSLDVVADSCGVGRMAAVGTGTSSNPSCAIVPGPGIEDDRTSVVLGRKLRPSGVVMTSLLDCHAPVSLMPYHTLLRVGLDLHWLVTKLQKMDPAILSQCLAPTR